MNIGTVYLIKDGKVVNYELSINKTRLPKREGNPFISTVTSSIEDVNPLSTKSDFELYSSYLKAGYSVIKKAKYLSFDDDITITDRNKITVMLPLKMNDEDTKIVSDMFNEEAKNETNTLYIESANKDELGFNYDYYMLNTYSNFTASEYLSSFLDKKSNHLTQTEEDMFNKYYNFDLKTILTDDVALRYPVNNTDAGVMIITPDKVYKRTLRKLQHGPELCDLMSNIHHSDLKGKTILELLEYNDILIQLSLGDAIIWMPKEVNEYQLEQVSALENEIDAIRTQEHTEIHIELGDKDSSYNTLEEYEDSRTNQNKR